MTLAMQFFPTFPGEERNLMSIYTGLIAISDQRINEYQSSLTDHETIFKRLWHQATKAGSLRLSSWR